jgi:hypothetical protein
LCINEDHQVFVKSEEDIRQYGSAIDSQAAISFLSELREKHKNDKIMLGIIVRHLCCTVKVRVAAEY